MDGPPPMLVLFDGTCAVCDAGMTWLMDHDPEGRLHYAPLAGPTAAPVLARHPEIPEGLDSIVVVYQTPHGERATWHSDALITVAGVLPPPWSLARVLRAVPRPLRDLAYRAFASVRYRLFGRVDPTTCRLPSPREAERMLP